MDPTTRTKRLQGQKEQQKMLPKSKCQAYIGFDDGARAIKYYNTKMRKVLTSCNFHNINPPDPTPPEYINVTPNLPCEGESDGNTPPKGVIHSDGITRNLESKRKKRIPSYQWKKSLQ